MRTTAYVNPKILDMGKSMPTSTPKLVTIGLPMYKRLGYLPNILRILSAQDYPEIELIVSDNGMNGDVVRGIVAEHYKRPCRFRQNEATVGISEHFNQIILEATGEYFMMLCDDDEISSNYVSQLVTRLERHPEASIAYARQENIDESGVVVGKSSEALPETLSGPEFIKAMWGSHEFGFHMVATFIARTDAIRRSGGYPDFPRGCHIENVLVTKLCLNSHVVFSPECVFRWRVDQNSLGWAVSVHDFAAATRGFLRFLDEDSVIHGFVSALPEQGKDIKHCLSTMAWKAYFWRWMEIYKNTLSPLEWIRAAFVMPFIPAYYRQVAVALIHAARRRAKFHFRCLFPAQVRQIETAITTPGWSTDEPVKAGKTISR